MAKKIKGCNGSLRGEIRVPGDKSIGHRAVIFGAIGDGVSRVSNLSGGDDNARTVNAFELLGVRLWQEDEELCIEGQGWSGLRPPRGVIDCGNSGTTMRLLAGLLAGRPFAATLDGDASLRRRPMQRIIDPLARMGGVITSDQGQGLAPLRIQGQCLQGIRYASPVASAQVKSAILLAGLQATGTTTIVEPQKSRDHTEIMARALGATLRVLGCEVSVTGCGNLSAMRLRVPGDLSSAAFFAVAAAASPGSEVLIRDVGCNPTRTGILDILDAMGAGIEWANRREENGEPVADLRVKGESLRGVEVGEDQVARTIDEYPILFVAAALARGRTVFRGIGELRYKESDRIATMTKELGKLGVRFRQGENDLEVDGGVLKGGGPLDTYGDHRVAMALAVAGLNADGGVELDNSDCVAVSFPGFFEQLERIAQ